MLECSDSVAGNEVDVVIANFSNINQLQDDYARDINTMAKIREITKQELFSE